MVGTSPIFKMTKSEYKKIVDNFLIANWSFLNECANNILRTRSMFADDLVGELVLFLYTNQRKLNDYIEIDMLQAFCVSWMKLQTKYDNTPFAKKFLNQNNEEFDFSSPTDENFTDVMQSEDDYVKDLLRVYTDEQVSNILKIHNIYPELTKVQKVLFDAYFIENLSYDKIKDKYTFFREKNGKKVYYKSKKSIYNLMNELKSEIKKKL